MHVTKQGYIQLDLSDPSEACLAPAWWEGQYPSQTAAQRLAKISEAQNHRCCYCGKRTWLKHYSETGPEKDMATREHVHCQSKGGKNGRNNIVMACSECNNQRDRANAYIFLVERNGPLDWEIDGITQEREAQLEQLREATAQAGQEHSDICRQVNLADPEDRPALEGQRRESRRKLADLQREVSRMKLLLNIDRPDRREYDSDGSYQRAVRRWERKLRKNQ